MCIAKKAEGYERHYGARSIFQEIKRLEDEKSDRRDIGEECRKRKKRRESIRKKRPR